MSVTREFRLDDRVTVMTESGRTDGPCFVLVHGIGMGHRYWSDLADDLAREGRVLALDLPGFGDAPEPEHPLSMPESGAYLAELLEAEGLDDIVLIGHSMGTQIVAEAAAQHPERIGHLVLIAPTVNPRERSMRMQAFRLMQDPSLAQPKVVALGLLSYLQAGPRWYFAKLRQMLDHRVEVILPRVTVPTLVIRGEHDRLSPRGWAQEVARLVPNGRYAEIPDRGHETMVTAGGRVAELVVAHARDDAVGERIAMPAEPAPPSRAAKAAWWARDYVYAARRQLAWIGRGRRSPRAWQHGDATRPTVVLVPGVYEHWTFIRPLGDALNAGGHRIVVVHGLGANRRPIAETSALLARALGRTTAPAAGRVIVGHSKGGLIGKHLLLDDGAPALGLHGVVAICTPFAGARRARIFLDPSIRALLPSDETIVLLAGGASVNSRIVSIFGLYDPHVPDGSMLEGATNVRVPVPGHFRVLGAPETHRAVLDGIALLAAR